jgi:glycosyltransferase involved in cell wall biosynthesis
MPEPIKLKYKILQHATLSKIHVYILSKYFRYVVAVSNDLRNKFIQKYRFKNDKIILIHNGVDIPNDHYTNRENDVFVIGSAGRLHMIKHYPLMVEIAREVLQQADNIIFKLAGDGSEKDNILEKIRKFGIEKEFILTGFNDDITSFYKTLNLYINTSLHEGLPMSILEAMAYGLPIIAINSGGLPEIVKNGFHGYLVDGRDPKMFAQKCLQIINNNELALKMGIASRERIINEFSVEKMSAKYYEVYKHISK